MSLICDVLRPETNCSLRVIDMGSRFRSMVVFFIFFRLLFFDQDIQRV